MYGLIIDICNGSASYKFENLVDSVNDISESLSYKRIYSRTSVARTLMARLPRLFRTRS